MANTVQDLTALFSVFPYGLFFIIFNVKAQLPAGTEVFRTWKRPLEISTD